MSRRGALLAGCLAIAASAAIAGTASAQPYAPYDGHGPFNCELQDVGTGTDFPHPDADPFCVEFDKTQQNVTDLGIFDFLSKEPARVAAAAPKCFYFQRDHWTGSVVQGQSPELWHWDGSYFFDKASASGGANLANFRVAGQAMDATPYAPADFQPYLSPGGGGGAYVSGDVQADPSCAARVDTPSERAQVYYHTVPAGSVSRTAIGPFSLSQPVSALHAANGPAHETLDGSERFNATGGGQLRLAYAPAAGEGGGETVAAVLSISPASSFSGVHPGDSVARLPRGASPAFRVNGLVVYEAPKSEAGRLFFGTGGGVVQWIAIVDRGRLGGTEPARRTLALLDHDGHGRVDSTGMAW